jgi:hypothetical protein
VTTEKFSIALVGKFEQQFGRNAAWWRTCDLMIEYFSRLEMEFSAVAALGLKTAVRYQQGEVPLEQVLEVRLAAWQYLKDRKALAVQKTPDEHLIQALSLLLYAGPGPGEPFSDSAEVVLSLWDVAHRFDGHPEWMMPLINRHFAPKGVDTAL